MYVVMNPFTVLLGCHEYSVWFSQWHLMCLYSTVNSFLAAQLRSEAYPLPRSGSREVGVHVQQIDELW